MKVIIILECGVKIVGRVSRYHTKQSTAIADYIMSLEGGHTTAGQIASYFEKQKAPIGLATIYRHLDRLVENKEVRRYIIDGISGACYQYITNGEEPHQIHLKCEECGAVLHLQCDMLEQVPQHVYREHAFKINPLKTVFYGRCLRCME